MRDHGNSYITFHLVNSDVLPKRGFPVIFHGIRGNQELTKSSPSYFNVLEASTIRNYCVKLINDTDRNICENEPDSGSAILSL
jgi:helicase MOV-10